jgi:hypothetical protein
MMLSRGGLVGLFAIATGCSQLGAVGDVLGGAMGANQSGEIVGEVDNVDTRTQTITLRNERGQTATVAYDNRTRVIYQQQEYSVTNLERGDVIAVRAQQDARGNLYTDMISVRQSVQDRGGAGGTGSGQQQVRQLEGQVGWVDTQRGQFQLRMSNGGSTVVSLPYNTNRSDADRFQRLRSGDRVRVEVRVISQDRVDLERFL